MMWIKKNKKKVSEGDVRNRRAFLIFPKCINGTCMWLEWSEWVEEVVMFPRQCHESGGVYHVMRWIPIAWGRANELKRLPSPPCENTLGGA